MIKIWTPNCILRDILNIKEMEELQNFKLADLFDKLRLDDDEFHEWLADIGLLHGSRTCTCGNLMKRHRAGSGSIHWRCNRAMHRPSQPSIGFKVGTFFENAQLDCKTIFKLAYFLSQRPSLGPQLKQDHMLKQKSQKIWI